MSGLTEAWNERTSRAASDARPPRDGQGSRSGDREPASSVFAPAAVPFPERHARRLLNRVDLCAYVGDLAWSEVARWIDIGLLPRPLFDASILDRSARWDVRAVSRSLSHVVGQDERGGDAAFADPRATTPR